MNALYLIIPCSVAGFPEGMNCCNYGKKDTPYDKRDADHGKFLRTYPAVAVNKEYIPG